MISLSDIIIIVICIIVSFIFFIFLNRDKFSLNCKKNHTLNMQNDQTSIKFNDEDNFDDNIKLIRWTLSTHQSNYNEDNKIIEYINDKSNNKSKKEDELELL